MSGLSEAVGQLNALEGKVAPELLQVLRQLAGNCRQAVAYRGPVTFDYPTPVNTDDGIEQRPPWWDWGDFPKSGLGNPNSNPTGSAAITLAPGSEMWALGKVYGALRWVKVTRSPRPRVNPKNNRTEYWFRGWESPSHTGIGAAGPEHEYLVVPTGDNEPDVGVGEILGYYFDQNRTRVCVHECCGALDLSSSSSSGSSESESSSEESSSAGSESSGTSSSGSGSSGSSGSVIESSKSSGSSGSSVGSGSSGSSLASSSGSEVSGSSGSAETSGGSEGSTPSSGSDKSTAIVPASWSPTGYTALFVMEAPEVRFDDVIVVKLPVADTDIQIDPKYLEVCEPGSVEVCGCALDLPVAVGAVVEGTVVRLRFGGDQPKMAVRAVIRLTGIRKGFAGLRFPDRTATQFEANERFIRSAYPGV